MIKPMPKTIEVSHRTIIFTALFLLGLWFLYQIRTIILGLFVSVLLMMALLPAVDLLSRYKIPRALAIVLVYILTLLAFGGILAGVIPPLVDQTSSLATRIPTYLEQVGIRGIDESLIRDQIAQIGTIPADIVRLTLSVFSNLITVFAVLVITFYLLLERDNLNKYLTFLLGQGKEKKAKRFIDKLERRLGGWVRAEIILMSIVGVLTYIGLRLLGIHFALPLALLAGVLEIVPNIGPVVAAVPAVLAGLTVSPVMGLAVAALYFLIQQLENSLIVPKVMEKSVGVRPLVTIISLAIGFKLAGIVGAVLAVPVVLVLQVASSEVFASKRFEKI